MPDTDHPSYESLQECMATLAAAVAKALSFMMQGTHAIHLLKLCMLAAGCTMKSPLAC